MYSLCFSPDSLDTLRRVRIWRLFAWCLLSFALSLLPRLRKLGERTADVSGFAFSPARSTVRGTEKMPGIYLLSAQSNAVLPQTRGGKGMAFVQSEGFTPGSAELPLGRAGGGRSGEASWTLSPLQAEGLLSYVVHSSGFEARFNLRDFHLNEVGQ